jgi:predicted nuclease of predicted toxin-antitoxin system
MGVPGSVIVQLRQRGHDAVHLREQDLQRLPDDEIFQKAIAENRILLTFDLDFGEIVALSGNENVGIVVFRLRNTRANHVLARLEKVLAESSDALEEGAVITVEEHRHRIRRLPFTVHL